LRTAVLSAAAICEEGIMDDHEDGYSGMFYVMLIVGIIGVLGFVLVAAGAGS
jgi:hypothetical protein